MTTVVNIRTEPCDVYCGRAGHGRDGYWGNPHDGASRSANIELFTRYFYHRLATDRVFEHRLEALRNKKLGCFCKPLPCHVDIIAEYLNGT